MIKTYSINSYALFASYDFLWSTIEKRGWCVFVSVN